ncbi:MAG: hypothetical protein JST68_19230 [Bacteroidetes bacterium]|nr:hypothetical protein [Bacteroidota bacterium]
MPAIAFLFLLICAWLSGVGLLRLFHLRLKPAYTHTLAVMLGVAAASFIPFLLQLCYIPLNGTTVFGALFLSALLLNIPAFLDIRKQGLRPFLHSQRPHFQLFRRGHVWPKAYEIPYWLVLGFLIFVSVWRCYYLPPTSRDALSGPEAIAEYAVREQTMINSFFDVDLWSTNNQFKSPFLISLQLIYKLAGFPFGQVWLSLLFICFTVFLYHALKERLHPLLAGLLLLLFTMCPEIYAYSFMILYDYSNMVFFFLGLYFLFRDPAAIGPAAPAPSPHASSSLSFAGLLLGIATYIRSETVILVGLLLPAILLMQWRKTPRSIKKIAIADALFLLPSLIAYYLQTNLYIQHYLPVHYNIGSLVNNHLENWSPLFQRYRDIITVLLFGTFATQLWGYIFYLFITLFVAELIFIRRLNRIARNWLYAMLALYLALGALGFTLPMFNLLETTKRALFKLMPLVLLYLANNELLLRLSGRIARWEMSGSPASHPAPAVAISKIKKKGQKK